MHDEEAKLSMSNILRNEITSEVPERLDDPEIISVRQACKLLNVHRNTLYKLIREGEIPAFRLIRGGRWRFRKQDLEDWLHDRQARRVL